MKAGGTLPGEDRPAGRWRHVGVLGPDATYFDWANATPAAQEFYVNSAVQACAGKKLVPVPADFWVKNLQPVQKAVRQYISELYAERAECRALKLSAVFGVCFTRAVQAAQG